MSLRDHEAVKRVLASDGRLGLVANAISAIITDGKTEGLRSYELVEGVLALREWSLAQDAEIERLRDAMTETRDVFPCRRIPFGDWKEAAEYRTMAEHIEQRPEGMTEEEAAQDFIERALANSKKLERWTPDVWIFICRMGPGR